MSEETENVEAPNWLSELEAKREKRLKARLGHEAGAGAPCLTCNEKCPGLDLHFWRKICKNCKCSKENHDVHDDDIYGWAQFQLLGSKPNKIKRKIVLPGKKDEVELDWAPKGQAETIDRYLKTLPPEALPVKGSKAAQTRKQLLQKQIPIHDLDPALCHDLTESELQKMQDYIDHMKQNSVGVGQVVQMGPTYLTNRYPKGVSAIETVSLQGENMATPLAKQLENLEVDDRKKKGGLRQEDHNRLPARQVVSNSFDPVKFGGVRDMRYPYNATSKELDDFFDTVPNPVNMTSGGGFGRPGPGSDYYINNPELVPKHGGSWAPGSGWAPNHEYGTELYHDESVADPGWAPGSTKPYPGVPDWAPTADPSNPSWAPGSAKPYHGVSEVPSWAPNMHFRDPSFAPDSNLRSNPGDPSNLEHGASRWAPDVHFQDPSFSPDPNKVHLNDARQPGSKPELEPGAPRWAPGAHFRDPSLISGPARNHLNDVKQPGSNSEPGAPRWSPDNVQGQTKPNLPHYAPGKYSIYSDQQTPAPIGNIRDLAFSTYDPTEAANFNQPGRRGLKSYTPTNYNVPVDSLRPDQVTVGAIRDITYGEETEPVEIRTAHKGTNAIFDQSRPGQEVGAAETRSKRCQRCDKAFDDGDFAILVDRADALYHSDCFKCAGCNQSLADMVYFYDGESDDIYCGRDFAKIRGIPRCKACDELIFVKEYCLAENSSFHVKHFCCFECDEALAGQNYVVEDSQPLCLPCFEKVKANRCEGCERVIKPDEQGVNLNGVHFHASDECFACKVCGKPLMGAKLLLRNQKLFCSHDCYGKSQS